MLSAPLSEEIQRFDFKKTRLLIKEGDRYLAVGDQLKAQRHYYQALNVISENKQENSLLEANVKKKLGDSFRDLGKNFAANRYYAEAIAILEKHDENNWYVQYNLLIINGQMHHIASDQQLAEIFYNQALQVLPVKYVQERARLLRKLGDVNRDAGNYSQAEKYYKLDLDNSKVELEKAGTYRKLGSIYLGMNEDLKALDYYKKALAIKRKHAVDNEMTLVNILNGIGTLYYYLNNKAEAISAFEEAISIIEKKEHLNKESNRYKATALKWLARIHSPDKKAKRFLTEVQRIENDLYADKTHIETARTLYHFGLYYKARKKYDKAHKFLSEALPIFQKTYPSDNRYTKEIQQELQAVIKQQTVFVVTLGLAGSGKTTYCERLSKKWQNGYHLPKDDVCSAMLPDREDYSGEYYKKHVQKPSYETLVLLANNNSTKISFLDGYFVNSRLTERFKEFMLSADRSVKVICFHCSGATQKERVEKRNADHDNAKRKEFENQRRKDMTDLLKTLEQITGYLVIDTDKDFESNEAILEHYINSTETVRLISADKKSEINLTDEDAMKGADRLRELLITKNYSGISPIETPKSDRFRLFPKIDEDHIPTPEVRIMDLKLSPKSNRP